MTNTNTPHDSGYKHLFSHPEMVKDLLQGFVPQDWVKELDFSTLEKMPDHYVSDDLRHREDDIMWQYCGSRTPQDLLHIVGYLLKEKYNPSPERANK